MLHFAAPRRSLIVLVATLAALPAICQTTTPAAKPAEHELRVFDPSLVDKTVDPCENFYRYSCNGWFKRNPLPADQASYGRFTELMELNRLHLKQILEETSAPAATRTANEQKTGDEYASCMDTVAINKLGLSPLFQELERIAALKTAADLPARAGASACHRRERILQHGIESGLRRLDFGHQLLWCGRAGFAGARLLHPHRRQVTWRRASNIWPMCAGSSCWPASRTHRPPRTPTP